MSRLTAERVGLARETMARYPVARSALIPLLHLAQEQDGYVAEDAMEHIAELIGATPAEVYGTASFYEMFKFHPVGRYLVGVCTNISCLLLGADELLDHVEAAAGARVGTTSDDGLFTVEDVECIAACTLAPCLQVNYRYFPNQTPETVDRLLADLRAGRLDAEVPPHGTLARVRQHVESARWAGSGTAPAPTAERFPGAALAPDAAPLPPPSAGAPAAGRSDGRPGADPPKSRGGRGR